MRESGKYPPKIMKIVRCNWASINHEQFACADRSLFWRANSSETNYISRRKSKEEIVGGAGEMFSFYFLIGIDFGYIVSKWIWSLNALKLSENVDSEWYRFRSSSSDVTKLKIQKLLSRISYSQLELISSTESPSIENTFMHTKS